MAITLDGTNGISTPDLESTGNITANGLTTELRPLVLGTAQASTSGTAIDFTGIPSWAKRVTVMFVGVSTNGTSQKLIQLGDSGGIETAGYLGAEMNLSAGTLANVTSGFGIRSSSAADLIHGTAVITLVDANTNVWAASGTLAFSSSAVVLLFAGSKALSATLDRVRITTVNGTDTFDAGSINIMYE